MNCTQESSSGAEGSASLKHRAESEAASGVEAGRLRRGGRTSEPENKTSLKPLRYPNPLFTCRIQIAGQLQPLSERSHPQIRCKRNASLRLNRPRIKNRLSPMQGLSRPFGRIVPSSVRPARRTRLTRLPALPQAASRPPGRMALAGRTPQAGGRLLWLMPGLRPPGRQIDSFGRETGEKGRSHPIRPPCPLPGASCQARRVPHRTREPFLHPKSRSSLQRHALSRRTSKNPLSEIRLRNCGRPIRRVPLMPRRQRQLLPG
jgi:hypothetical protein